MLKKMSFGQLQVAFGMILHQATPDQVRIMRNVIPRVPWAIFSFLGPRAYLRYAARLRSATVSMTPTAV